MDLPHLLDQLDDDTLRDLADALALVVPDGAPTDAMRRHIAKSDVASLPAVLAALSRDALKALCKSVGLTVTGSGKGPYVKALADAVAKDGGTSARALVVEVQPRQPRLAWQGMDQHEAVTSVPTQVVEIVWPGRARALESDGKSAAQPSLLDANARAQGVGARARGAEAPNRLIWTNDNLVALQALLDERDPTTHAYRYRGKVDLVYIDPPFMVNTNFSGDNRITIDLDENAGIEATKEPSLVEFIAYRDTWRNGLDSFLVMLRRRLEMLKELLSPSGSIYIHLDWHAVHYVKVLMDEIFGSENFRNEIVWQRTSAHNDPKQFGRVNDRILFYVANKEDYSFNTVYGEYSQEQLSRYDSSDSEGRFTGRDLTAPGIRHGETGQPWRGLNPAASGRHWSRPPSELEELLAQGRILLKKDGTPRLDGLKVYLHQGWRINSA